MTPSRQPRRKLSPKQKLAVMERQDFCCACECNEPLGDDPRDIEFDHIRELWDGGDNNLDNFQALIKGHHRRKTNLNLKQRAKLERIAKRHGLMKRRMNADDRELARRLERMSGR